MKYYLTPFRPEKHYYYYLRKVNSPSYIFFNSKGLIINLVYKNTSSLISLINNNSRANRVVEYFSSTDPRAKFLVSEFME